MRVSILRSITCSVMAAVLVTSCTNTTGGTAAQQADPEPPNPEIPKVTAPLDETPFLDNPCKLIDPEIITAIGDFDPGEPDVDSEMAQRLSGPSCSWRGKIPATLISLSISTVHREYAEDGLKGIAGIYSKDEAEFEPVEIPGHPGYPAAFSGMGPAGCPVYVGIADDLTIVVVTNSPGDPCDASLKLAASALDNLKKGAN